jgi:hypothetical protein
MRVFFPFLTSSSIMQHITHAHTRLSFFHVSSCFFSPVNGFPRPGSSHHTPSTSLLLLLARKRHQRQSYSHPSITAATATTHTHNHRPKRSALGTCSNIEQQHRCSFGRKTKEAGLDPSFLFLFNSIPHFRPYQPSAFLLLLIFTDQPRFFVFVFVCLLVCVFLSLSAASCFSLSLLSL